MTRRDEAWRGKARRGGARLGKARRGDATKNGVLAGYPLIDVKAKLYDGSYHEVDS